MPPAARGMIPLDPAISFAGSTVTVQRARKKALERAKPRFRALILEIAGFDDGRTSGLIADADDRAGVAVRNS